MKKTKADSQVIAINASIELAMTALQACKEVCAKNGSPIRSITYRVLDNGETKTHITYRRK